MYKNEDHPFVKINLESKKTTFFGKRDTLGDMDHFYHYSQSYLYLINNKLYCTQSYYPYIEIYDLACNLIKKTNLYSSLFKYQDLTISYRNKDFIEKISTSGFSNEWVCTFFKGVLLCGISYKLDNEGYYHSLLNFYDGSGELIGHIEKPIKYLGSDNINKLIFYDERNENVVIADVKHCNFFSGNTGRKY